MMKGAKVGVKCKPGFKLQLFFIFIVDEKEVTVKQFLEIRVEQKGVENIQVHLKGGNDYKFLWLKLFFCYFKFLKNSWLNIKECENFLQLTSWTKGAIVRVKCKPGFKLQICALALKSQSQKRDSVSNFFFF